MPVLEIRFLPYHPTSIYEMRIFVLLVLRQQSFPVTLKCLLADHIHAALERGDGYVCVTSDVVRELLADHRL